MPKRAETSTATLEPPRRPPEAVAADAAEKSESLRRQSLLADWHAWREIVSSIAAGREPDGRQLSELASLADRLRLPEGALAAAVDALAKDSELREHEERAQAALSGGCERGPLLAIEVAATRRRLDELLAEQRSLEALPIRLAAAIRSKADHRHGNPLVFLPAEELVERSIQRSSSTPKAVNAKEGWLA